MLNVLIIKYHFSAVLNNCWFELLKYLSSPTLLLCLVSIKEGRATHLMTLLGVFGTLLGTLT